MVTVWRGAGFRIVIFTNDHEPAHVHVFGEGEAKINLVSPDDAPALVWAENMKRGDVHRAMQIVTEKRDMLLGRWRAIHG